MKANHARETELWMKIHEKGSSLPKVTNAQALDVTLRWGWIDGIRKSFDERSFLQRYTPRRPRSIGSQVNAIMWRGWSLPALSPNLSRSVPFSAPAGRPIHFAADR